MKKKESQRINAMHMALDAAGRSGRPDRLDTDELARAARRFLKFLRKGK